MEPLAFRNWRIDDIGKVAKLVRDLHTWTDETFDGPFHLANDETLALGQVYSSLVQDYDNAYGTVIVAYEVPNPDVIVGVCQIVLSQGGLPYKHPRKSAEIRNVFVTEEYRSSGVGMVLIEEAVNWAHRNIGTPAVITLFVDTDNRKARQFYEKLGFKQSHCFYVL